ncbi:hypothetical protein DFH08DRAFT_899200 [Mycena albidolilacea]|uniref:Uncharacterized protein n=1 Tax=Mycena albidolilacea TaxID=1033008 RepID=A0AAD6Z7A2_9AGAR|nr:hypothetical protein DFH08DRAFT_899200 [Mycena albidolilacea]
MPLPPAPHEDDAWGAPPPPALRVSSPPHLHVDTAPAADADDVDVDEREQDLASTLSAFSTTASPSAARARALDDDDESAALLPHHESSDDESSSSEDEDEEDDIADTKRATTAWSRRAAAAPALGLPSSTREKEAQVPGAFPGTATSPNFPALSLPAAASTTEEKDAAGTSTAVEKAEKDKARARKYRSPLDAALAMQLRPGLGVGADGAWLVRFLMSFFGWFAVLVARTSD